MSPAVAAAHRTSGGRRLPGPVAAGSTRTPGGALVAVVREDAAMGGRLVLRVTTQADRGAEAAAEADRAARRVRSWAAILTRHTTTSALARLNADPRAIVPVGPTLAAALRWAREATEWTGGIVDPTLLDERLAAEAREARATSLASDSDERAAADRTWSLVHTSGGAHGPGRGALVARRPGLRLDLDGVAKGWIADRALALLDRHPGALVDADGDIAIRIAPGDRLDVGVADPRTTGAVLAILALEAPAVAPASYGVATSGTSVHRWRTSAGDTHHLIDPRTRRPAATDVAQATVIAGSARVAEALAKTAVILGAADGLEFLARAGATGAVLLLRDGRAVALPSTTRFLA